MQPIIDYFQNLAETYKAIGHSDSNCRFAGSYEEFMLLSKSKLKIKEFCIGIEFEVSEWVNRNEAETELIPIYLNVFKCGKIEDFALNYTIMTEAKAHLIKLYSKIMKDRREQATGVAKFLDVSNKKFQYIALSKGDLFVGAQLELNLKLPINYSYDPADWN